MKLHLGLLTVKCTANGHISVNLKFPVRSQVSINTVKHKY